MRKLLLLFCYIFALAGSDVASKLAVLHNKRAYFFSSGN